MPAASHAATAAAPHIASAGARSAPVASAPAEISVMKLMAITGPIHLALPLIMSASWGLHPQLVTWGWVALHLLFPVVLIATYKWWVGQGEKVFLVLVLNHIITFLTFGALSVFRAVV